jgi:hypothetical protein
VYLSATTGEVILTPTLLGTVSATVTTGMAYTEGTSVTVTSTTPSTVYYMDITAPSSSISFTQDSVVELFMIGGGGGGGTIHAGGGGAGSYYYTNGVPISIPSGTQLDITVGAGGLGGTSGPVVQANNGGDTYIQVGGVDFQGLRVKGGGAGGSAGGTGFVGGCGGAGASYNSNGVISGGASNAVLGKAGSVGTAGGNGYADQGAGVLAGGGGGGAGGQGQSVLGGSSPSGGRGGAAYALSMLNTPIAVGGGGGGGCWDAVGGGLPGVGGSVIINGLTVQVGG